MGRWKSSLTFLLCVYLILWNAIDFWRGLLLPSFDGLGICEVDSRLRNKRIHLVRKKKKDKIKEMWESTSCFFCWCLLLFLFCGNSSWFNVLLTFEIHPGEQGLWTFAWEFPFSIDFSTAVVWLKCDQQAPEYDYSPTPAGVLVKWGYKNHKWLWRKWVTGEWVW